MKFVHMADMHFDSVFSNLSDNQMLGNKKRIEQREVFKEIIQYIKENKIPYFFIAGDLYENEYIKNTTIEYINKLFKEIPNTKIFISPGNHDPYIKSSFYNIFEWAENVKIFGPQIEKVSLPDVDIYGYGFDDFYCTDSKIENLKIENTEKINILVIHGTLDGASIEEKQYNSMSKKMLQEKGFDYIALGHIHKLDYDTEKNQRIVYPGSTVSLGFDEIGEHGIIEGNIDKEKIELKFIPMSKNNFVELEIDITDIISFEELIEKIKNLKLEENNLYKIILIGKRNFEINIYDLYNYDLDEKIIKIKNKTKINYNLEEIANDTTLKGLFAKEMLNKIKNATDSSEIEIIENAIEIGMEAFK